MVNELLSLWSSVPGTFHDTLSFLIDLMFFVVDDDDVALVKNILHTMERLAQWVSFLFLLIPAFLDSLCLCSDPVQGRRSVVRALLNVFFT